METPKVYQPGEGSEVEVLEKVPGENPIPGEEVVLEEGSGDYVEETNDSEAGDDEYAKQRSGN